MDWFQDDEEGDGEATAKKSQGRRKPAYAGGLVLEPKKGEAVISITKTCTARGERKQTKGTCGPEEGILVKLVQ